MVLLATTTLAAAVTASTTTHIVGLHNMEYLVCEAKFVRAGGGTTAKFWVQTSIDGGLTWVDIINFAFLTTTASKITAVVGNPATPLTPATAPSDGTLADDTIVNGVLGSELRVKYTTTGTYTGASSIAIYAVAKPFHV
jgi:hypothetical protein